MSDREILNPFEMPPWPNMLRVGLGGEHTVGYVEILNTGEIQFFDDPLGHPVLVLTPDNLELVQFWAAHLEGYQDYWEKEGRANYQDPDAVARPSLLPGPNDPRAVPLNGVDRSWFETALTVAARNREIVRRLADEIPCSCDGSAEECPDRYGGGGPPCVWPRHWATGYRPDWLDAEDEETAEALPVVVPVKQPAQPAAIIPPRQQVLKIDGVVAVRRSGTQGDD